MSYTSVSALLEVEHQKTYSVRVNPDQARLWVSLEGARDGAHGERVVAAKGDGELATARVLIHALGQLLRDL